jgi:hypothetical protein
VVFSDIYLENEATLKSADPIWIKGSVEHTDGVSKLLLSKKSHSQVLPLRHAYEALAREMHLYFPLSFETEKLEQLQGYIQSIKEQTGTPLFVHLLVHDKAETILKMKETIPLRRETVDSIRNIFQKEPIRIEFR